MKYELDDTDRALIEKFREAYNYHLGGDPIRDFLEQEDLIDMGALLLNVIDEECK